MKDALLRLSCLSLGLAICLSGCAHSVNTVVLDKPVLNSGPALEEEKPVEPKLELTKIPDEVQLGSCSVEIWNGLDQPAPFIVFRKDKEELLRQQFSADDQIN